VITETNKRLMKSVARLVEMSAAFGLQICKARKYVVDPAIYWIVKNTQYLFNISNNYV
jgi:hypothetical protein